MKQKKKAILSLLICCLLCIIVTIQPVNAAKASKFSVTNSSITVKKGKSKKIYCSFYFAPFHSNIEAPALYANIKASSNDKSIATIKKSKTDQALDFFLPITGEEPTYKYVAAYNITGKKAGTTYVTLKLTYARKTYTKKIKVTVKK